MKKISICVVVALMSFSAMADQHASVAAELKGVVSAFNAAYANNKVEEYFSYYADDPTLYWDGARQGLSAYHESWQALVNGGGAVEKNDLSDMQVKVLPGGQAAVVTYFVDYRLRGPDGSISEFDAFETDVWQKIDGAWKVVSLTYTEIPAQE